MSNPIILRACILLAKEPQVVNSHNFAVPNVQLICPIM